MEKKALKKRIEVIEGLFQKDNSSWESNALASLKSEYKVRKRMGLLGFWDKDDALDIMVGLCESYLEVNGEDAEWFLRKWRWGFPLETAEKVKLAEYHTALQIILIGLG